MSTPPSSEHALQSASAAMEAPLRTLRKVAKVDLPVLLSGPSGSGKTTLARALHALSTRSAGPCVTLDCSSVSDELLESELFGHTQGAFTGAHRDHVGVFERADRGTLILDEVGAASPALQVALLRAVERKEITPLGAIAPRKVDVRIVATTSLRLQDAITEGRFREDLWYRLAVVPIELPPLDARREDIPQIAATLLRATANAWGHTPTPALAPDALRWLQQRPWPGGIRELDNVLKRALALSDHPLIQTNDLQLEEPVTQSQAHAHAPVLDTNWLQGENIAFNTRCTSLPALTHELEALLIPHALQLSKGNQREAAQRLKISLRKLVYRLQDAKNNTNDTDNDENEPQD